MNQTTLLAALSLVAPASAQFGAPSTVSAQIDADDVIAVDVDIDGDEDLVYVSRSHERLAWFENLSQGTFGSERTIATNVESVSRVVSADLDGDGNPDLVCAPTGGGEVNWYQNLGSGTFASGVTIAAHSDPGFETTGLCVADLDSDGDMDVIAPTGVLTEIAWYENLGGGTFSTGQLVTNSAWALKDICPDDLDGDGDIDLITAQGYWTSLNRVAWYENLGSGVFGPAQDLQLWSSAGATAVTTTDLDGDGDQDAIGAFWLSGQVTWWENLGQGNFGGLQSISSVADYVRDVEPVDVDGDGDLDVVASHDDLATSIGASWHENRGGGVFVPHWIDVSPATSVEMADLDGDGNHDLVYTSNGIAWCRKRSVVTFTVEPTVSSAHWAGLVGDWFGGFFGWGSGRELARIYGLTGSFGLAMTTEVGGVTEVQFVSSGGVQVASDLSVGPVSFSGVEFDLLSESMAVDPAGEFSGDLHTVLSRGSFLYDTATLGNAHWDLTGARHTAAVHGKLVETVSGLELELDIEWKGQLDPNTLCGAVTCTDYYGEVELSGSLVGSSYCSAPETYCDAQPNSSGQIASIATSGSTNLSANDFTVLSHGLPTNQLGIFIMSRGTGDWPLFAGGQGTLCLGAPVVRIGQGPLPTGSTGSVALSLDLFGLPDGIRLEPGSRWHFQLWHRDSNPMPTTNLSQALAVTWCP